MKNLFLGTRYWMSETDPRRLPPSMTEITFVGRSNVGKSSVICGLTEDKKLARVSKMPGRTRGINIFEAKKGRWLVDLPGFGFADAPERAREYWPRMIGGYLTMRPNLKMIYLLIDAEQGVGPLDISLLNFLSEKNAPCRIVGTKVDRLSHSQQIEQRKKIGAMLGLQADEIYWVSAQKGYGMKELRADAAEALGL